MHERILCGNVGWNLTLTLHITILQAQEQKNIKRHAHRSKLTGFRESIINFSKSRQFFTVATKKAALSWNVSYGKKTRRIH
jgi:hypothetical protein